MCQTKRSGSSIAESFASGGRWRSARTFSQSRAATWNAPPITGPARSLAEPLRQLRELRVALVAPLPPRRDDRRRARRLLLRELHRGVLQPPLDAIGELVRVGVAPA